MSNTTCLTTRCSSNMANNVANCGGPCRSETRINQTRPCWTSSVRHMHIYIYIERERDREIEIEREREGDRERYYIIICIMYNLRYLIGMIIL